MITPPQKKVSICCPNITYLTLFSLFLQRQGKFQSKVIFNKMSHGLMGNARWQALGNYGITGSLCQKTLEHFEQISVVTRTELILYFIFFLFLLFQITLNHYVSAFDLHVFSSCCIQLIGTVSQKTGPGMRSPVFQC